MRFLPGLCLTSLCCCAMAQDTPKEAAARRLVGLLQMDEAYVGMERVCRDSWDAAAAASGGYKMNPEMFGGLSPSLPTWTGVVALYREHRNQSCAYNDLAPLKEISVQVFANRLSLADLNTAVAQASTARGRALQSAATEAARMMTAVQVERQLTQSAKADAAFMGGLEKLKASHAAPECQDTAAPAN